MLTEGSLRNLIARPEFAIEDQVSNAIKKFIVKAAALIDRSPKVTKSHVETGTPHT